MRAFVTACRWLVVVGAVVLFVVVVPLVELAREVAAWLRRALTGGR